MQNKLENIIQLNPYTKIFFKTEYAHLIDLRFSKQNESISQQQQQQRINFKNQWYRDFQIRERANPFMQLWKNDNLIQFIYQNHLSISNLVSKTSQYHNNTTKF